jgi:hypothetical protein
MWADINVDPPYYQMNVDEVDSVKLYIGKHRNIRLGCENRYIQIHNRGIKPVDPLYENALEQIRKNTFKKLHS